ncbi:MAG: tetratricopeptide repeat protein [Deltaproteobacteria bacterium]|nr:tetratricopeptide repeat protein [Deltaproteobacteria bacterium]MBW2338772.1 tetratricopeptide repeat protein [Deltaproteobacteria bacterium]
MRRPLLVTFGMLFICAGCVMPHFAILSDPLSPEEHLELGIAYEKKGEFDNAIKEYEVAAKKRPVAYLYLGNAHFQKNELDKAEKYYKKAIKKEPQNADSYNNLAWLYYAQRKNLDKAESLVLRAMQLNPSKSDTYKDTLEKIRELKNPHR